MASLSVLEEKDAYCHYQNEKVQGYERQTVPTNDPDIN